MRDYLEKEIETHLVKGIKTIGGIAYKFVSPQRRSVPDRIIVLPGNRIIFVELKKLGGKLTSGQVREIDRLRALGCDARVLVGMQEVKDFIQSEVILSSIA